MKFPQAAASALGRRLLLARHHLARALARARIGMRALAAYRKAAAMADAAIASEVHQALDRLLHLAAQIALDLVLLVDHVADMDLLLGRQLVAVARRIDLGLGKNLQRRAAPDSIDIGQRDFHPLVMRQLDSGDTCHAAILLFSRLNPGAACDADWNTGCAPRPGGAQPCSSCRFS